MESDLIPYTASPGLPAQAVLVLAPHPDDEVFGCAGAIVGHVRAGVAVAVVVLTDGAGFGEARLRCAESGAAARLLGYGEPEFWLLPDRGLRYSEELVLRLVERISKAGADLVYAPSPWELHPDHRQTCLLALAAVRRIGTPLRLAFYEVGAPLRPNVLVDITDCVNAKDAAMRCFASQLAQQDYLRQIHALNQYRSYTLAGTVLAAEAFCVLGAQELGQIASWGLVSPGTLFDAALRPGSLALVSILIRSMDRDHLAEALDSVALQTYPHIEVVVAAACPGHRPLPTLCGPFAVRLLQTDAPLPRSKAANLAMAHAKGQYLLFLDDDDWLMPGHIARLVDVLSHQPHALAAYTGISLVDAVGRPLGQSFELPFDAIRQLAGNLTPIHAVLFNAKVLELGCHFDEALDRYEDWDFWLQLARLAPMVHLPGVSGAYRIHGSSGVHEDAGPAGSATGLIYRKWGEDWTPQQIGQMMQRVWSHPELEARLTETTPHFSARLVEQAQHLAETTERLRSADSVLENHRAVIAHQAQTSLQQQQQIGLLSQKIDEMATHLAQQQQDHAALLGSRSWRVTRPLRWLTGITRNSPVGGIIRQARAWLK
ncbi:MAG: PIG-L family deacetylase [Rhodoferax sp.]|nr:PIG-L family deacetylase [Rhodoferax sp.]